MEINQPHGGNTGRFTAYSRVQVRCIELGIVYPSLTHAAIAIGCGKSAMSNHLAGRFPHIRGLHFERVIEPDGLKPMNSKNL